MRAVPVLVGTRAWRFHLIQDGVVLSQHPPLTAGVVVQCRVGPITGVYDGHGDARAVNTIGVELVCADEGRIDCIQDVDTVIVHFANGIGVIVAKGGLEARVVNLDAPVLVDPPDAGPLFERLQRPLGQSRADGVDDAQLACHLTAMAVHLGGHRGQVPPLDDDLDHFWRTGGQRDPLQRGQQQGQQGQGGQKSIVRGSWGINECVHDTSFPVWLGLPVVTQQYSLCTSIF